MGLDICLKLEVVRGVWVCMLLSCLFHVVKISIVIK